MLELKHIHKYYNPGTVNEMCLFQDFNLTIEDGEFVSVVGSNGSGKTSMLNIYLRKYSGRRWTDLHWWKGYLQRKGISEKPSYWSCVSESGSGNLSVR